MELKAMKSYAKEIGVKVSKKDDEDSLAKKLREKWEEDETEMEFQCPSCDEEIPDLESCPFCGASFDEEESEEEEEENGEDEEEESEEDEDEESEDEESEESDEDEDEDEEEEKPSKKKAKGKGKKKEKPAKKAKGKDKKKSKAAKRGPKAGGLNFQDAVNEISSLVDKSGVEIRAKGNFTSYFYKGVRLFHIAKTTRSYTLLTNLEGLDVKVKDGEYTTFTPEEIESGHLANAVGLLKTTSLAEVKTAVKKLIELGKAAAAEKAESKKSKKKVKGKKVAKKEKKSKVKEKAKDKPTKKAKGKKKKKK